MPQVRFHLVLRTTACMCLQGGLLELQRTSALAVVGLQYGRRKPCWHALGVEGVLLVICTGVMLLAPESRGSTWDALPAAQGAFGPDVAFVGAALSQTLASYSISMDALGIQGFSDGATYALGLGKGR